MPTGRTSYFTSVTAPNLFPHFAIGLFAFSYAALSTRFVKVSLGLDHNVCPRLDLDKYGKAAVEKGKLTQEQLNQLYRRQGAHANAVENLPYFFAAAICAQQAGLPNAFINRICLVYSLIRIAYAYAYINIASAEKSYIRSLLWWAGNSVSFATFVIVAKEMNGSFF